MTDIAMAGPLFTDLYELTMAAAYFDHKITREAAFSLFIRKYPPNRGYFVAAGLEEALSAVESFVFSGSDIDYLKSTGKFSGPFLDYLENFRFSGTIRAMPEGTVFFKDEPMLEVSAPLIEAQVLETFLINTVGFQTLIAAKAARCMEAAQGRSLVDFSARRTQGIDASVKVARSAYIAGFTATSNVLAGKVLNIPISGTMAHSFVTAFDSEEEAFAAYAETYPDTSIFLIDTYDTIEGARAAARVGVEMKKAGRALLGVRLDSGDMADLSRQVRKILDKAGLEEVKIFASSGFDEFEIADVIRKNALIDAFGVGTKMGVSADAPYLNIAYKMVRYHDKNVRKLSPGKVNLSGEKQVFRMADPQTNGFRNDVIGAVDEEIPGAEPLLSPIMQNGRITGPLPSLDDIRARCRDQLAKLAPKYKSLEPRDEYPVTFSRGLTALQQ